MVREQALQSDQGLKKVIVLRAKDDQGEPYYLEESPGKRLLNPKGEPIPGYRPEAVDVGVPGVLRDGFREIHKGVKEGDLVVVLGMQKIRLGEDPITKKPFLVAARAFNADRDAADPTRPRTSPAPAPGSVVEKPAGNGEKSLAGDKPAAPPARAGQGAGPAAESKGHSPASGRVTPALNSGSGSGTHRGR